MFTGRQFSLGSALAWSWEGPVAAGLWAAAVTAGHVYIDAEWFALPALPVTVLGTAVSFYLGFKGNAAYERLWEARKIWGGIVNSSRTWGLLVTTFVSDMHADEPPRAPLAEIHRELVYRHVAWLYALRCQLLRPKPWEHRQPWNDRYREIFGTLDCDDAAIRTWVAPLLPEGEVEPMVGRKNTATALIHRQGERLRELFAESRIEDFRHMELAGLLEEFYTLQGKAERIKNFPLPRQYATANHWFVKLFILLLPFALLQALHGDNLPHEFVWLAVPLTMVVGWVFWLWDLVVDYTENPFEGLINDIPMLALSRTIEIDLREMLGETELPPPIQPVHDSALF